nr:hypothetical protein [Fodinicola feengrottensis]
MHGSLVREQQRPKGTQARLQRRCRGPSEHHHQRDRDDGLAGEIDECQRPERDRRHERGPDQHRRLPRTVVDQPRQHRTTDRLSDRETASQQPGEGVVSASVAGQQHQRERAAVPVGSRPIRSAASSRGTPAVRSTSRMGRVLRTTAVSTSYGQAQRNSQRKPNSAAQRPGLAAMPHLGQPSGERETYFLLEKSYCW